MNKSDLERIFESRCRTAINYSNYRCAFFFKLNIVLCFFSLVSLWCSGYVIDGTHKTVAIVLNAFGSVMLVIDVILNLLGCYGKWKSMHDGYNSFLAEFTKTHSNASVNNLEELMSRFIEFDGRCHAVYNALGVIAWNETCVQMGKKQHVKPVPWYKRLTKNWFTWGSIADNFK